MKRMSFEIPDDYWRLLKSFAKANNITEQETLQLCVWAYLLPLKAAALKPPVGSLPKGRRRV